MLMDCPLERGFGAREGWAQRASARTKEISVSALPDETLVAPSGFEAMLAGCRGTYAWDESV